MTDPILSPLLDSYTMKRLNSNKDDNVPIYIYILLVVILTLSFLGTYLDSSKRVKSAARS